MAGAAWKTCILVEPAAVRPCSSSNIFDVLGEDVMAGILCACKTAGVLAAVAGSSRQVCSLARSRVPVCLHVDKPDKGALVLSSSARGIPFSGCTQLQVAAVSADGFSMAAAVCSRAQQWSGLRHVQLFLLSDVAQLQPPLSPDYSSSAVLCALPALRQLRSLHLVVRSFGSSSAQQIGQLVHLTSLQLMASDYRAVDEVPPDLSALSCLSRLQSLEVTGIPPAQPAAGAQGPFCLPSSLTQLVLSEVGMGFTSPLAHWVTHLPACVQLQHLHLQYGSLQHKGAHPSAVARMLQSHRSLRVLKLDSDIERDISEWDQPLVGLPSGGGRDNLEWRPHGDLAALTGLECLTGYQLPHIRSQADWGVLARLSCLTKLGWAHMHTAPVVQAAMLRQLRSLEICWVHLGGRGLGQLLLNCPSLHEASVRIVQPTNAAAVQPGSTQLQPHPRLKRLCLDRCYTWGTAAASEFDALVPVLSGVSELRLEMWPGGSATHPTHGLPDLSVCTGLTSLYISGLMAYNVSFMPATVLLPSQAHHMSMLTPLVQLRKLTLKWALRLNARAVATLQHMLPQLSHVELHGCGKFLTAPGPYRDPWDVWFQYENEARPETPEQALAAVLPLLRPGLQLHVWDDFGRVVTPA